METYVKDWYKSRGVGIWEEPLPCEFCLMELIAWWTNWVKPMVDVHHINPWAKTRQYKKDWTDLIGCCRSHHIQQTENNASEKVEECLAIAKESIIVFNRMKCKEKLRALVEFLYLKHIDDKINWVHQETD